MTKVSKVQKTITHLCFISLLVFDLSVKAQNALRARSGAETKTLQRYYHVHKSSLDVFQRSSHHGYAVPSEKKEHHQVGGTKTNARKGSKEIGKQFGKKGGKAGKRANGKQWSGKSNSKSKWQGNSAPSCLPTPPTDTIPPTPPPTKFATPTPPTKTPNALPTPAPSSQPSAEKILLYSNDFESPKQAVVAEGLYCPIDFAGINNIYGTDENTFHQTNTVEAFLVNSTWNSSVSYSDPQGRAGSYAISMLSSAEDDLLGLSFETSGKAFVNVAVDISSIDLPCAGGPFTIAAPIFRVSLLNAPFGTVPLTGPALDFVDVTGPVGPNQWTFLWTRNSISLNATGSSSGRVSVVFDLIQSGYAALDNLIIHASNQPGTAK
ncbi:hypothetical protein MHU86_9119 [Fragilaria crotonensis]|nr:hypothetical protein MHU86_9119 [Fragilaria crotonensis]